MPLKRLAKCRKANIHAVFRHICSWIDSLYFQNIRKIWQGNAG